MIFWVKLFAISALLLFVAYWYYKHIYEPQRLKKQALSWINQPKYQQALKIYNSIYSDINTHKVAKKARRAIGMKDDSSLIYGEIEPVSFIKLLELVTPQSGEIFVDFGSGAGKAVYLTALLYPEVECYGIELLQPLHNLAVRVAPNEVSNVTFINDNILNYDLATVNIVFINATGFFGELWDNIQTELNSLPSGARVIITTKKLNSDQFELIDKQMRLMSWGTATCSIYRKSV